MENKHLTPYNEHVYIKVNNEKNWEGHKLPIGLNKKIFRAKRTGSHTWQPIISFSGACYNIYPEQVDEIYTKESHPQMFQTTNVSEDGYIYLKDIKDTLNIFCADSNSLGKLHKIKYISLNKDRITINHSKQYMSSFAVDFNLIEKIYNNKEDAKKDYPEYFL